MNIKKPLPFATVRHAARGRQRRGPARHTQPIDPRRGFTLRELTLAIAIGSTVMMVAVGMVHDAFDWSKTARHRRLDDQSFFHLARQFRSDVHQARTATFADATSENGRLQMDLDTGESVRYTVDQTNIVRVETRGEATLRREVYRFDDHRIVTLDQEDASGRVGVTIRTRTLPRMQTPGKEDAATAWRSLRASVGLRVRHQNAEIES